jgi:septum formation protein
VPDRLRLVLASASPRRRDLLAQVGLVATVEPADVDERLVPGRDPVDHAVALAAAKAAAVAGRHTGTPALVLGADTVVVLDGEALGKPRDADDARRALTRLSGRRHDVVTAWSLVDARTGAVHAGVGRTAVWFRALSADEITAYVATGEPLDKAGAYGIQGVGALLVERIDGDHATVVGLPVAAVALALRHLGLDALRVGPV